MRRARVSEGSGSKEARAARETHSEVKRLAEADLLLLLLLEVLEVLGLLVLVDAQERERPFLGLARERRRHRRRGRGTPERRRRRRGRERLVGRFGLDEAFGFGLVAGCGRQAVSVTSSYRAEYRSEEERARARRRRRRLTLLLEPLGLALLQPADFCPQHLGVPRQRQRRHGLVLARAPRLGANVVQVDRLEPPHRRSALALAARATSTRVVDLEVRRVRVVVEHAVEGPRARGGHDGCAGRAGGAGGAPCAGCVRRVQVWVRPLARGGDSGEGAEADARGPPGPWAIGPEAVISRSWRARGGGRGPRLERNESASSCMMGPLAGQRALQTVMVGTEQREREREEGRTILTSL